jgi:hypothetical protein
MYSWSKAVQAAPVVAALLAAEFNWDSSRTAAAITGYSDKIGGFQRELGLHEG